ncbi:MAG TPA: hypothetical protein VFK44_05955, partial [Bacillales bacterium]|nr:hypothetical protein [Bacillales bacterium]
ALKILYQDRGKFDVSILNQFSEALHIFPPSAVVTANDGRKAIVIDADPYIPHLPWLMFIDDASLAQIPNDLSLKVKSMVEYPA